MIAIPKSENSSSQVPAAHDPSGRKILETATVALDKASSLAGRGSRTVLHTAGLIALLSAIASKSKITTVTMSSDEFTTMLVVGVLLLFGGAVIESVQRHRHITDGIALSQAAARISEPGPSSVSGPDREP
jgi:hypothetical protein